MRMDEWDDATFWNSFKCETDGVDRGQATESSSNLKGSDAANVSTETPTLVKPEARTDIDTSGSASKVKDPFGDVMLGNTANIERDRDSSVHFQNPSHENVDADKEEAAAESSAPLASSKRKRSKRKGANAPKKKRPVLRFEED